ncbi:MAG: hypothetical protein WHS88_00895 [Anaerohalosphaeraceae bacterium]
MNSTRLAWLCLVIHIGLVSCGLMALHRWQCSHDVCSAGPSDPSHQKHESRSCRTCQIFFCNLASCLAGSGPAFSGIRFLQNVFSLANDGFLLQTVPSCLSRRGPPA